MSNTSVDIKPLRKTKYGELDGAKAEVMVHHRQVENQEANFAMGLMEKWAMVVGTPDGEDNAGRQKFALMSIEEVVTRACDLSARAFEEFDKRGWLTYIPSLDELEELVKNEEDRRKN